MRKIGKFFSSSILSTMMLTSEVGLHHADAVLGRSQQQRAGRRCNTGMQRPRAAAQAEATSVKGPSGTYSGANISKPRIGSHFLHIDDYSKEVNLPTRLYLRRTRAWQCAYHRIQSERSKCNDLGDAARSEMRPYQT